jgi:uncharacterized coiled-coil DUF342 family protein
MTTKDKVEQVAAAAPENITLEQARELRDEISKLHRELYQAKTEAHRARTELDAKQKQFDGLLKSFNDDRAYVERAQEELLSVRQRNIVLRDKLLTVHRAVSEGVS